MAPAPSKPKGERLEELRDLAKKDPFDERGNQDIKPNDISLLQIREYLQRVGSRLADSAEQKTVMELLDQMDLLTGPTERRSIKNVAVMMFCEHMEKFFRTSQVEIVIFPEGREENPNNLIEAPVIKGTVPQMISETLNYLRLHIVRERIIKPKDNEKSIRFFNYPYQALEEAVANALYPSRLSNS